MPVTLANFKQAISATILRRGRDYYDAGRVTELDEVDAGSWQATVEGEDAYEVIVQFAPTGEAAWSCSCPYDHGPVCKHVAAVFYAVEAAAAEPPSVGRAAPRRRLTRSDRVRAALQPLSRDELSELLVDLAHDNRDLAHLILTRYSPTPDTRKAAVQMVKDALQLGRPNRGFLDYWGSIRAAQGVQTVLGRARKLLEQGEAGQAVPIFQAVIEVVVPAVGQADDSSGGLGGCIEDALEDLRGAAQQLTPTARQGLFAYLLAEAPKPAYAGWDWRWSLMALAGELVVTPAQRSSLFSTLDAMAAGVADEWLAQFAQEQAARLKMAVIQRLDGAPAVLAFLQQHTHLTRLRLQLAHFYLEQGEFAAARQLCRAWLEQAPPNARGLHAQFQELLLQAAVLTGDRAEQIALAEALFLETGEGGYYRQLKATLGAQAWLAFRDDFLTRARASQRVDLGPLYVAEEQWDALLKQVQANPGLVERHHQHLAGRFPEQVGALYERLALTRLARANSREGYREVCHYLQQMQALGMHARVAQLVEQWRAEHKRRRALQEELDKAFGR